MIKANFQGDVLEPLIFKKNNYTRERNLRYCLSKYLGKYFFTFFFRNYTMNT